MISNISNSIQSILPMDFIPKKLSLKNCSSGFVLAKLGIKGLPTADKPAYLQNITLFGEAIKALDPAAGYLSQGSLPPAEHLRFIRNFSLCVNEIQNIQNLFLGGQIDLNTMEIQIAYATISIPWTVAYRINSSNLERETLDCWYTIKRATIHIQLSSLNLEEKDCPLFRFQAVNRSTGQQCFAAPNCFILNNGGKKNLSYLSDYSAHLCVLFENILKQPSVQLFEEQLQEEEANRAAEISPPIMKKRSRVEMESMAEDEFLHVQCTSVEYTEESQFKYSRTDHSLTDFRIDLEFISNSDSTAAVIETPTLLEEEFSLI